MSDLVLYAQSSKLVNSEGATLPANARPLIHWREKVSFIVTLPGTGTAFTAGTYLYAFDVDRDFLNTAPCNTGECTLEDGNLHFTVIFDSISQARATNGRKFPIPFYIQVTRQATDESGHSFADYILDDAIWADGCVWDGNLPAGEPISNYYTKAESDALLEELTPGGGGKPVQADWEQEDDKAVDYIKNKPTIPSDYIPKSAKGAPNGVPSLDANGLVPDSQITLERPIVTIPPATTAYAFADGAVYQHTPTGAPIYTLPTVTDTERTHTVIITVSFAHVLSVAFAYAGSTVAPLDTLTITGGDVVEYLCRYDGLQGKWCIACGKLNQ